MTDHSHLIPKKVKKEGDEEILLEKESSRTKDGNDEPVKTAPELLKRMMEI